MAATGNPILAYNSFLGKWSFSETICSLNALGMTYLGKNWTLSRPLTSHPGIQSIVTLTVLALQRYMMVTRCVRLFTVQLFIDFYSRHQHRYYLVLWWWRSESKLRKVSTLVLCCTSYITLSMLTLMLDISSCFEIIEEIFHYHYLRHFSRDRQFPLSTCCSTLTTLLFIWVYSFLVSFPPLTGFGTFGLNTLGVR